MSNTGIEYGDASWNITSGCSHISAGCDNCWANKMSKRLRGRAGYPKEKPFTPTFHADRLEEPYGWRKKRNCVLVSFMGDLFHDGIKTECIYDVLEVIAGSPDHTFMILTKRPKRWHDVMNYAGEYVAGNTNFNMTMEVMDHLPNLWLGVSLEDNSQMHRLDELMKIPAAGRFISAEPLIGALDLDYKLMAPRNKCISCGWEKPRGYKWFSDPYCPECKRTMDRYGISLVLVGGESGGGKHVRPMHPNWVRDIQDSCMRQSTNFYFKQWGDWAPWNPKYSEIEYSIGDGRGSFVGMQRIGKKRAGHLWNGQEFRTMPPIPVKKMI